MNNTTNHNSSQIALDALPPYEETALLEDSAHYVEQGFTGTLLRAKLIEVNSRFIDPVSDDFIEDIVSRHPDKPTALQRVEQAIKSGDSKQVLQASPLIAQLERLQEGIILGDIKANYPGLTQRVRGIIADEKRKAKLAADEGKLDVADITRQWTASHYEVWAYDSVFDTWRCWTGAYWQEQPKTHLLDKEAVTALQDNGKEISNQAAINTFERLAEADCLRDFTAKPGLINFANGTLDIATKTLHGYEKDDNLTYCLPYSYNPYGSHNTIDAFLSDVLPDSFAVAALMAHVGLSLMGDLNMHYFYCMIGSTRSGKSTILALINATCGAMDPKMFAGHSIFSRDVEGKRSRFKWSQKPIVCIDELPSEALREEELLKAMSAHSGVEMRGIGKDEQTNNRWKPKLVMATNDQPRYNDTSSAIKERAVFVELGHTIPKADRDARLFDKLSVEIGAWVVDCLDLAEQVLEIGYYPLSAEMQALRDRIAAEGNTLKDFIAAGCVLDANERIASAELYNAYKEYCLGQSVKDKYILSTNSMTLALRSMNIGIIVKDHPIRINGKLQRGLHGIRLRTFEDPDPKPKYEDDPPLCIRCKQSEKTTVYALEQPDKPTQDGLYTVYTQENSNFSQYKNDTEVKKYIGGYRDENNRIHRIQGDTNEPDKPTQGVYGQNNGLYTPYTSDASDDLICQIDGCNEEWIGANNRKLLCIGHLQEAEYKAKIAKTNGRASR